MSSRMVPSKQRILVIDDNRAIHADFRKILGEPDAEDAALLADEAEIFGTGSRPSFDLDTASQGEEGLNMVVQALRENRPYSLAFVDVRMPPGWDGIETTRKLWEVAPDLQIVICTAYSDCSWTEMHDLINPQDRLLILKKPFDTIEVLQLANTLTEKWRLLQEAKTRLGDLERMVGERTRDLEKMMKDAVRNREQIEQAYDDLKRETSERQDLEKQCREQSAQLLRSQRMESVGRLASGIAHDMNNILAPILLSVFMLRRQLPPEEFEKTLHNIETSTKRGADLVKQLLTFGRGASGRRELVRIGLLTVDMEKLIRSTFPKDITFSSTPANEAWPVMGDATQLHQVLLNLCVNARDAMPRGGKLSLAVENVRFDENYAAMHAEATPGPYLCLRVTDTGEGMPPELMDKIFDPFFTTKEIGSGTGLGLATVLGVIKGHKGFVNLKSQVGVGSTFEIYLPASPEAVDAPADAPPPAPLRGQGEVILVVDDEPGIRDVLRKTLLHHGYNALSAGDGIEAIVQYSQHRNDIKAVITDIMMPLMDGVTMTRALKRMDPALKVIASSGIGSTQDKKEKATELNAIGVTRFLSKPYTAAEILAAVSGMLAETNPPLPSQDLPSEPASITDW